MSPLTRPTAAVAAFSKAEGSWPAASRAAVVTRQVVCPVLSWARLEAVAMMPIGSARVGTSFGNTYVCLIPWSSLPRLGCRPWWSRRPYKSGQESGQAETKKHPLSQLEGTLVNHLLTVAHHVRNDSTLLLLRLPRPLGHQGRALYLLSALPNLSRPQNTSPVPMP